MSPVDAAPYFHLMGTWATPMHQPSLAKSFVSRVKIATVPKPWGIPSDVEKKIHVIYQKSEFVEKRMKSFLGRWAWGKGEAPAHVLLDVHVAQTPLASLLHLPWPF